MAVGRDQRYSRTAMALHWLLALLIVGAFSVGVYMADLPLSPQRLKLFNWHKWTGVCILALSALAAVVAAWPAATARPAWPGLAAEPGACRACHAVPAVFRRAAGGLGLQLGGGPAHRAVRADPAARFRACRQGTGPGHQALARYLAFTLAALVLLHVAAALKHHWVDRDGLLSRMWPARS